MGDRNDNHFVPQFYLRYWSADEKRTNLFNFSRARAIEGVSIKDQCRRNNFYGFAPRLEEALGGLEGAAAEVIRMIRAARDVPPRETEEWTTMLTYIVFQKLRTTNAAYLNDAMTEYLGSLWLEGGEHKELKDSVKLQSIYPVALPMSMVDHVLSIAYDLRMHLLVNETAREFITSDDPVVLHNQYCEGITYRGVLGWNCVGLQVVFPVSPRELVILFDPTTYKIGRSHRGVSVTKITAELDVEQLNSLQILNARHNVYYAGGGEKVKNECAAMAGKRPKTRTTFVETEAKETGDPETSGALLHMYEVMLAAQLTVGEFSIRKDRRRVPLHSRGAMYRKLIPKAPEERAGYGKPPAGGSYAVKKITHI